MPNRVFSLEGGYAGGVTEEIKGVILVWIAVGVVGVEVELGSGVEGGARASAPAGPGMG